MAAHVSKFCSECAYVETVEYDGGATISVCAVYEYEIESYVPTMCVMHKQREVDDASRTSV